MVINEGTPVRAHTRNVIYYRGRVLREKEAITLLNDSNQKYKQATLSIFSVEKGAVLSLSQSVRKITPATLSNVSVDFNSSVSVKVENKMHCAFKEKDSIFCHRALWNSQLYQAHATHKYPSVQNRSSSHPNVFSQKHLLCISYVLQELDPPYNFMTFFLKVVFL